MKILIVDDESDIKRLFEQRFRKERYKGDVELYFAYSGEEALRFLSNGGAHDLTLLLSDVNMPKMSGLELLKIVKEEYPSLKVLIITAYGDKHNRKKALQLGASDYLTKPLNFKTLKEKILFMN